MIGTTNITKALLAIVAAALCLAGCTTVGTLNATATANMNSALAVACPVLLVVESGGLPMNAIQKASLQTLALACPPNPPPTSAVVAAVDIMAAYSALKPLITK